MKNYILAADKTKNRPASGFSIDCLGCGEQIPGEFKLCPKCCQLLGAQGPARSVAKRVRQASSLSLSADRDFAIGFSVLGLASIAILIGLTMTWVNPLGAFLGRLVRSLC